MVADAWGVFTFGVFSSALGTRTPSEECTNKQLVNKASKNSPIDIASACPCALVNKASRNKVNKASRNKVNKASRNKMNKASRNKVNKASRNKVNKASRNKVNKAARNSPIDIASACPCALRSRSARDHAAAIVAGNPPSRPCAWARVRACACNCAPVKAAPRRTRTAQGHASMTG